MQETKTYIQIQTNLNTSEYGYVKSTMAKDYFENVLLKISHQTLDDVISQIQDYDHEWFEANKDFLIRLINDLSFSKQ